MPEIGRTLALVAAMAALSTGCASVRDVVDRALPPAAPEEEAAPPPAGPAEVAPGVGGDSVAWRAALDADGERIVVSREARRLWLMRGDSALFTAPVAVGRDTIFHYGGRAYDFSTPTGRMVVLDKETDPVWVPPNWHYYEKAVERGIEPVQLEPGDRVQLSDSTWIEVKGTDVGRLNRFGYWRAFTPGSELIFDDKIFIPPFGSPQRKIPEILGTHRLILGDGYLIHGTPEEDSIGEYASHGCVRMFNHDVEHLYGRVEVGVPVYIY